MKRCFKCQERKPVSEFYAHPQMADGLLGKCKDCTKCDVAHNYRNTIDAKRAYERERCQRPDRKAKALEYQRVRRKRHPEKNRARAMAAKLPKQPCAVCGTTQNVQAHHDDYSRPLDVRWLCFKHHREVAHGQQVAA